MPLLKRVSHKGSRPRILLLAVLAALVPSLLSGCALIRPLPPGVGLEDRLAAFPKQGLNLEKPVRIFWNEHLVPYIKAETDSDLAYTLGLVHAHLRLAQMDIFRRASQGRLAEAFGPYFTKIDKSLRILGLGRSVPQLERNLPEESRTWLARYVEGINAYLAQARELPHEFRVLGLRPEPWKIADVLTLGRLFGVDVNWLSLAGLLQARSGPDWDKVWAAHLEAGEGSIPSFEQGEATLVALLAAFSKPGSNSIVLGPKKTATGSALMANDPHLGVTLPNLWLIAGYHSPSYNLVGLMVPGLPCITLGRNPYLGWGGTNMRAASSDLYDVSRLDPSQISETSQKVAVRWWFDQEVRIRTTPLGPVVTDAPSLEGYQGPPLALRWVGHGVTDEVSAILAANRARNWEEFLQAWKTYGVSSQNILMADNQGNIGQLLAVTLPRRSFLDPPDLYLDPANPDHRWKGFLTAPELPHVLNPVRGFLVSANNKPVEMKPRVGFSFTSNDRIGRLTQVLEKAEQADLAFLKNLQRDVVWPSGQKLVAAARELLDGEGPKEPGAARVWQAVLAWNGEMKADSEAALAVELLAFQLSGRLLEERYSPQAADYFRRASFLVEFLARELGRMDKKQARAALLASLEASAGALEEHQTWGAIHRLEMSHFFGRIPLIGSRYRFGKHPVDGGPTTLMKTAHRLTDQPHTVFYGSQARHISDFSDPDENYFLLLGGQDGILNSPALTDMVDLWLRGEYVRLPLSPKRAEAEFRHRIELLPGG